MNVSIRAQIYKWILLRLTTFTDNDFLENTVYQYWFCLIWTQIFSSSIVFTLNAGGKKEFVIRHLDFWSRQLLSVTSSGPSKIINQWTQSPTGQLASSVEIFGYNPATVESGQWIHWDTEIYPLQEDETRVIRLKCGCRIYIIT